MSHTFFKVEATREESIRDEFPILSATTAPEGLIAMNDIAQLSLSTDFEREFVCSNGDYAHSADSARRR
jgi:hypothetical protein